jgi:hypothetical protein
VAFIAFLPRRRWVTPVRLMSESSRMPIQMFNWVRGGPGLQVNAAAGASCSG